MPKPISRITVFTDVGGSRIGIEVRYGAEEQYHTSLHLWLERDTSIHPPDARRFAAWGYYVSHEAAGRRNTLKTAFAYLGAALEQFPEEVSD